MSKYSQCIIRLKNDVTRTSLAVQWLRPHASFAGGRGSIPGQGAKIPQIVWQGQKKKSILQSVTEIRSQLYVCVLVVVVQY